MSEVIIYTDGSCIKTNGGWAFFLINYRNKNWLVSGGERNTTNNRMEMTAVLNALTLVKAPEIEIRTDSQYVIGGCTTWREGWYRKNYRDVINLDLWYKIWEQMEDRYITFTWVPGHSGEVYNEKVDKASREEAVALMS